MEVSHAGSFLESPDQENQVERPEEPEQQGSMFDDAVSFDPAGSAEEMSGAATDALDGLQEEAVDETHYSGDLHPETVSEEETAQSFIHPQADDAKPETETPGNKDDSQIVLTMDDFAALEERVLKAVTLVRREREARMAAEERLLLLESQTLAQAPAMEQLHHEIESLRTEREQVRQRVERLLSQLDALEL